MLPFYSLANLAESEHEIPEKLIWNYLIDLLMVSNFAFLLMEDVFVGTMCIIGFDVLILVA